jgi:hypothetical protein
VVASCSGFIVPQSTPRQRDFLSPFLLLHAAVTLLASIKVSENLYHLHHSLCNCVPKIGYIAHSIRDAIRFKTEIGLRGIDSRFDDSLFIHSDWQLEW